MNVLIEQKNIIPLLSENKKVSLSFNARVSNATKLDNIKAVVLSWTGTADSVTSDVVSAWNVADTTPTFATNFTAENTAANLSVTATDTRFEIEDIAIDTSGVNNLVVFIWSDAVADNDTAGTLLQITDVQLEVGSAASDFAHQSYAEDLAACQRYFSRGGTGASGGAVSTSQVILGFQFFQEMRTAPTAALIDTSISVFNTAGSGLASSGSAIDYSSIKKEGALTRINGWSGGNAQVQHYVVIVYNNDPFITFSAEL